MKKIELKTLDAPDNSPPIEYKQILSEVIRRPLDPQKGIDISEMRASIRVLDKIEAANGVLELEDADYAVLKEKLTRMPWNLCDRRILELVDDVETAT